VVGPPPSPVKWPYAKTPQRPYIGSTEKQFSSFGEFDLISIKYSDKRYRKDFDPNFSNLRRT
jgi:hypothetical protein